MKLHFYGADRCVTGSCHCLEINGKKILVDCGLQQGRDELDNRYLAFAPGNIDILLVTHAHIDHTGRIPLLVKNGFHGRILTTRLTADLMKIMLLDFAHIQESDAEYENRKGERAGREHVDPLYTEQDALDVFKYVTTCEYKEKVDLCEGVSAVFTDAGHLLGSASITLELEENGVHKTIVFSGDIGNVDQPIIRDPQLLKKADYVVMEFDLRRPQPHRGLELHRRTGADHRRNARQGRQRRHPVVRRGPYTGAFVLYPRDQGSKARQVDAELPCVHRLAPCQGGDDCVLRRPARLS